MGVSDIRPHNATCAHDVKTITRIVLTYRVVDKDLRIRTRNNIDAVQSKVCNRTVFNVKCLSRSHSDAIQSGTYALNGEVSKRHDISGGGGDDDRIGVGRYDST